MIIVVGQPRTGTSLMMQMLDVAGASCIGEWPAFEGGTEWACGPYDFSALGPRDAVKLVWSGDECKFPARAAVIHTVRNDARQRALSEIKLARELGLPRALWESQSVDDMVAQSGRHAKQIRRALAGRRSMTVPFEHVLIGSTAIAADIAQFIGFGSPARMAAVVRPRSADSYPTMMEFDMIREREGAA